MTTTTSMVTRSGAASRSRLAGLAIALLAGLVLTVNPFFAAPASAASCWAASCNGKDPNAQGCTGQTVTPSAWFWDYQARVELRYASNCDANWARFLYSGGFNCCVPFSMRSEQQRWNGSAWVGYRTKFKTIYPGSTEEWVWTTMNPNETNDRHRACVYDSGGSQIACTAWVS